MSAEKDFVTATEMGAYRLTEDDRRRIIDLKLNRWPVRDIAKEQRTSPSTIKAVWDTYLTERQAERDANLCLKHIEAVERLEFISDEFHRLYLKASTDGNIALAGKLLSQQAAAVRDIAKLSEQSATATSGADQ